MTSKNIFETVEQTNTFVSFLKWNVNDDDWRDENSNGWMSERTSIGNELNRKMNEEKKIWNWWLGMMNLNDDEMKFPSNFFSAAAVIKI